MEKICNQIVLIDSGTIIYDGGIEKFTKNGQSSLETSFLGAIEAPLVRKRNQMDYLNEHYTFVIRLRTEMIFGRTNQSSIFSRIINVFLFMIAILYGAGFSFIVQYLKKTENFDYQTVFFIMNAILAFSIILKGYFPQYIPFTTSF